jgi:rhamnulokinase
VDLADLLAGVSALTDFAGLVTPDAPRFFNPSSMVRALRDALAATGQTPHDDPVLLTRVIVDSLALRYASVIEDIERVTGTPVEGVHVVGGGSLNDCLSQATADATDRPVAAGPSEATAIGNILVQAIAAGTLTSLAHGRDLVQRTIRPRRFEPHAGRDWERAKRRYLEMAF